MDKSMIRLWVFAIALLISSCGTPTSSEALFAATVPVRMDDELYLELVEIEYSFFGQPSVVLILENRSNESFWFPQPAYGTRIFTFSESDSAWVEVGEQYFIDLSEEEADILVPQGQEGHSSTLVVVHPDIPANNNEPVTLRIVVVGKVYKNGVPAGEEVGNYIDVTLQPPEP